ncbi:hypothetical protein DM01DRAFT_1325122 [Hesseltinella vesiculosa]|uniref:DUF803-domain-containing protein n=1 Tax=Hesseltinella vesiculosa TaxID=101127 RepID=A0A1X2GBR2_9FUNG|nr:hypothetical protein DM01DRAFT_1325122 [Hesseltinella vesiculosa]
MAGEDTVINFVIGVFVSLGASFMDALGLNILKLDHVREGSKPTLARRGDCGRPLWHIGLYTYIASQLIGSTIALNYLKTQWVAPLGSVALIYNFIFAKILVGTNITRKDVFGTFVVVASVIWIVVFGGMYNGEDPEASISLETLKTLFTRPIFIIYFSILNVVTFCGLAFAVWCSWLITERSKRMIFSAVSPKKMRKLVGLMFSLEGGLLASETLLLAKSGVKLFTLSVTSQVNQFTDNISRFIVLALLVTAILQVYCLNTALKMYSSVVVVPVFYGTYTALGLVNTIIYLDEVGNYSGWTIALVFVGIGVLIYGVYLLSSKTDPTMANDDDDDDENEPPSTNDMEAPLPGADLPGSSNRSLHRSSSSHPSPTSAENQHAMTSVNGPTANPYLSSSSSITKKGDDQKHSKIYLDLHEMQSLSCSSSTSSTHINLLMQLPPPPRYTDKQDDHEEKSPRLLDHTMNYVSASTSSPYCTYPDLTASRSLAAKRRWLPQWLMPRWPSFSASKQRSFFSLPSTASNTTTSTSIATASSSAATTAKDKSSLSDPHHLSLPAIIKPSVGRLSHDNTAPPFEKP